MCITGKLAKNDSQKVEFSVTASPIFKLNTLLENSSVINSITFQLILGHSSENTFHAFAWTSIYLLCKIEVAVNWKWGLQAYRY